MPGCAASSVPAAGRRGRWSCSACSARRWRWARPGARRCCWPMRWPVMPATACGTWWASPCWRWRARRSRSPPTAPRSTPARRHGGGCGPTRCRACLQAGPAQLLAQHTGELTATVVDRIEALDGLHSRWLPASVLAIGGPLLVALAALAADPLAALVLVLVRAAGPGRDGGWPAWARRRRRAASSWRWRGCRRVSSTACGASPPSCSTARRRPRHARLPRRRTNCGGAPCACCASPSCPPPRSIWRRHSPSSSWRCTTAGNCCPVAWRSPGTALFVLLLVPEFFAPLRGFAAAYQDRLHAAGAAEALAELPPPSAPAAAARGADRGRARHRRGVRGRPPHLGSGARAGAERPVLPRTGMARRWCSRAPRVPANRR